MLAGMKLDESKTMEGIIVRDGNRHATTDFDSGSTDPEKTLVRRLDEYDVDFSDTRAFCVSRWKDIVKTTSEMLSVSGN
jgi:hypothetical protein